MVVLVKWKTPAADFYQAFLSPKSMFCPSWWTLFRLHENQVEIYPWQKNGSEGDHTIKTPKVQNAGLVKSMETTPEYMQDNIILLSAATSLTLLSG